MFTRKTVFVVGAGASTDFKLPMGSDLKLDIGRKLDIYFDGYELKSGDRRIVETIRAIGRKNDVDPNKFVRAGRSIAAAMPQSISIDNFLHTHSHDEDIVFMGKLAIATCILDAERGSSLMIDQSRGETSIGFTTNQTTWLNTFFQMLCEGVTLAESSSIFDNVSVVTFNYDRCIEHYLPHALANYFRIDIERANELTSKLQILHPYGQVGRLPWQMGADTAIAYGDKPNIETHPRLAAQIRTFTERVRDDDTLDKIRLALSEAVQVVYLGFSYGQMNMDLMQIETSVVPKKVYGTCYKMSSPNTHASKEHIARALGRSDLGFQLVNTCELADCKANQLLNDYWYLIAR